MLLITGGAGFIGSNFVRHALAHTDDTLVIVDKLTYAGSLLNLHDAREDARVSFVRADIADATAMGRLFDEQRPDAVVNLAAETHVDRSIDGPAPFIATNIVGTFVLLEAARALLAARGATARERFRFLHVSTDEVYGTLGPDGAFAEDTPYAPNSPYAASKASADHLVRAYVHTYGVPAIITNCSNNYGPYQFPEKLIPLMTLNGLDGRPLPIYGDGEQVRDWLHVEDHCAGLLLALRRGRPGEEVQHRRRRRADESRGGGPPVRRARGVPSRGVEPGARVEGGGFLRRPQDVRSRSPGTRPALRDRRGEDSPRARVGAGDHVRGRAGRHRPVVRRARRLVRGRAGRPLRSRTSRITLMPMPTPIENACACGHASPGPRRHK